jgi:hypothetical protein
MEGAGNPPTSTRNRWWAIAEQLAQRAAPPSDLSLLGLIQHAAKAERLWFRQRVAGQDVPSTHPPGEADIFKAKAATAEATTQPS